MKNTEVSKSLVYSKWLMRLSWVLFAMAVFWPMDLKIDHENTPEEPLEFLLMSLFLFGAIIVNPLGLFVSSVMLTGLILAPMTFSTLIIYLPLSLTILYPPSPYHLSLYIITCSYIALGFISHVIALLRLLEIAPKPYKSLAWLLMHLSIGNFLLIGIGHIQLVQSMAYLSPAYMTWCSSIACLACSQWMRDDAINEVYQSQPSITDATSVEVAAGAASISSAVDEVNQP